jgi:hypothetical protein
MTTGPATPRHRWPLLALTAIYFAGVAVRFATAQLIANPLVSSDELVYRNMALSFFQTGSFYEVLFMGKAANLPNVLYSLLVSPSFFFGDHFFAVAQFINSLVIHLSLFAVYAMAREFVDPRRALVAAVVTALLPAFNTPMFFMTESLVYPVFLFAFYFAFKAMTSPLARWRVAAGTALAASMLVKPGFVFLFVATTIVYAAALAVSASSRDGARVRELLASYATMIVAALAAFAALSYALKGGVEYGLGTYQFFTSSRPGADPIRYADVVLNACAHVSATLFAWFVPAFVCARIAARKETDPRLRLFLALAFATGLVYLCGVLKLTQAMSFQEHYLRLHGRYYSMIFPLLVVAFLAGCDKVPWGIGTRVTGIALCVGVGAANIAFVFPRYAASGLLIVDYPDLAWHIRWHAMVAVGAGATLLVVLWHATRARLTPYPALALLAALSIMASIGEVKQSIDFDRINSAQVDPVKKMVRAQLPENTARVALVDSIHLCRFTIAFWYPYHYTTSLALPKDALVERAKIPADTEFIVACDEYRFDFPVTELAREGSKAIFAVTRE